MAGAEERADEELVLVPREAPNDDHALLCAWRKADGERVEQDEILCDLEFSKSVFELPAPRAGWLFHLRKAGEEVAVGAPLATIASRATRPEPRAAAAAGDAKISVRARQLMEQHGLDPALFAGIDLVKEKHVQAYLDRQRAPVESTLEGELLAHTPIRRRAASALVASKQGAPHSSVSRWILAERLEAEVERLARAHDMMLSVSDWLIAVVAKQAAEHPRANATWRDDGLFLHARRHVGFALNQADGELIVPVVHDADRLPLDELVGRIQGLQRKALRHKLTPADLSGGTITVTSLVGSGAHQVLPILVPGQVAIVALGDRCAWPAPAYNLTVAFDHRALNGTEAAAFLSSLAAALVGGEEPA